MWGEIWELYIKLVRLKGCLAELGLYGVEERSSSFIKRIFPLLKLPHWNPRSNTKNDPGMKYFHGLKAAQFFQWLSLQNAAFSLLWLKVKIEFYHHCGKEMQRLHYKKPLLCSAWSLWWSLRRWQGEVHLGLVGHHNATSHSGQARIILFYKTPFSPSFSWHLSACCQLALGLIRESAHHTINFCTKSAFRYDSSHFPLDTLKNPSSIKHCTDRSHFFFNLRIISYQPTSLVLIRDTETERGLGVSTSDLAKIKYPERPRFASVSLT